MSAPREGYPGPLPRLPRLQARTHHWATTRVRPFTLGISLQESDAVVKMHGLDVERRQDALLVLQRGVVDVVLIGRQDHAHVAQVDVDSPEVRAAQRRAL